MAIKIMPDMRDYYAFIGNKGPKECDLVSEFKRQNSSFKIGDCDGIPTLRMRDFFIADRTGTLVSIKMVGEANRALFLQGKVLSWDGTGGDYMIGGICIQNW
jgi:hypothetical protein